MVGGVINEPVVGENDAFAAARELVAGVETVEPPASWTEVVEQSLAYPYANAVNGALLHYDWTDLLK